MSEPRKNDFPQDGVPSIEIKSWLVLERRSRHVQMTLRAGDFTTRFALRVDGVTVQIETVRQKTKLLVLAQQWVAHQVAVFRSPMDLFRLEFGPAVGARYLVEQLQHIAAKIKRTM